MVCSDGDSAVQVWYTNDPVARAMSRDESVYKDPELFIPERFLTSDGGLNDDAFNITFGFGRRICPGRHVADATLWLIIVSVLSTFDFAHAKDAAGQDIEIVVDYSDTLVRLETRL